MSNPLSKLALHTHFNQLFDDEREMSAVIKTLIHRLEGQELEDKIFLRKIRLVNTNEYCIDTGLFQDTITIFGPNENELEQMSSLIPALQHAKLTTLLLLYATLKHHYREELLQQVKKKSL